MAFQVLVKTTPYMTGSYAYDLVSREAAEVFVKRSDVWWYMFPLDETWEYKKGGGWSAQPDPVADAVPLAAYTAAEEDDEDEDDDARW